MGDEMPHLTLCLPLPPTTTRARHLRSLSRRLTWRKTLPSSCGLRPIWTSLAPGAIWTQLEVEAASRGQAPPKDSYEEEGDRDGNDSAGLASMLILFLCVSI
jgi:hypothetical protein